MYSSKWYVTCPLELVSDLRSLFCEICLFSLMSATSKWACFSQGYLGVIKLASFSLSVSSFLPYGLVLVKPCTIMPPHIPSPIITLPNLTKCFKNTWKQQFPNGVWQLSGSNNYSRVLIERRFLKKPFMFDRWPCTLPTTWNLFAWGITRVAKTIKFI